MGPPSLSVPILMYHQVTPRPHPAFRKYAVTPGAFARHIGWLARAGYTPVDIDALLDSRHEGRPLPARPIVITFDDGFRDCIDYAVPVLQAHGFTAVFYLVAGLVGETSRWLARERGVEFALMDWGAAHDLETAGFHCGAHSMTHPRLTQLSPAACREELLRSRLVLEDQLGHEVRHLAYPFGLYDRTVSAIAAETGYRSACSVRIGFSPPDDDVLALHRVPVIGQDSLLDFVCRLHTTQSVGDWIHHKARNAWRRWGLRRARP